MKYSSHFARLLVHLKSLTIFYEITKEDHGIYMRDRGAAERRQVNII